jgi:hypothetical protein
VKATERVGVALAGVILASSFIASVMPGLNGDVQYVIGGLRATEGHETFVSTFVHRPLAYRAVVAGLDAVAHLMGLGPESLVAYEAFMRVGALAMVLAAIAVLWWGLRRWMPNPDALAIAGAIGLALAFAPAWDILQAEWVATLFMAIAVGTALGPRSVVLSSALSGLFALLAVVVKLATLAFAPLAFGLVLLVSRRRAVAMAVGGTGWLAAWAALVILALPLEWQWIRDMGSLGPNSPFRSPLDFRDLELLALALGSKVTLQPWLVVTPAAIVLLARSMANRRDGVLVAAAALVALALSITPILLQGQYSLYHLAALPVVAAAVIAAAASRWWRMSGRPPFVLLVPLPMVGVACAAVLAMSADVRLAIDFQVTLAIFLLSMGLAVGAVLVPSAVRPPSRDGTHRVAAAMLLMCSLVLLPAISPTSAWSLNPGGTRWTNAVWPERSRSANASLSALSATIGSAAPVLYLAYGDVPYHMGNPTDCPYPSPLFLQRGMAIDYVTEFASYPDNVACLASDVPEFMVLAPGWFQIDELQAPLRATLDATFDCERAITMAGLQACPRR